MAARAYHQKEGNDAVSKQFAMLSGFIPDFIAAAWNRRKLSATRLAGLSLASASLAVWSLSTSAGAAAQEPLKHAEVIDRLVRCIDIEREALRLQCYDSLVQPLAEAQVDPEFESDSTFHSFSGRDDEDTEVFTIKQSWRLRWTLDGSLLTIELRERDNALIDIVGNQIGAGHGQSEKSLPPGVYRLAVRAIGDWQIAVEPE